MLIFLTSSFPLLMLVCVRGTFSHFLPAPPPSLALSRPGFLFPGSLPQITLASKSLPRLLYYASSPRLSNKPACFLIMLIFMVSWPSSLCLYAGASS